MTPRQISMLAAAGGSGKQHAAEAEGDVCGSAGNTTTVRAIDAPYMYSSRQRRRELRQQADRCADMHRGRHPTATPPQCVPPARSSLCLCGETEPLS